MQYCLHDDIAAFTTTFLLISNLWVRYSNQNYYFIVNVHHIDISIIKCLLSSINNWVCDHISGPHFGTTFRDHISYINEKWVWLTELTIQEHFWRNNLVCVSRIFRFFRYITFANSTYKKISFDILQIILNVCTLIGCTLCNIIAINRNALNDKSAGCFSNRIHS